MHILCSNCANEVLPGTLGRCEVCGGILRPYYPDDAVSHLTHVHPGPGIDRFRAMMPVLTAIPFLGEGDTPLIRSRRLGPALGLSRLYFKNEGRNPTGAFKDRAAALAAALAVEAGAEGIVTASSGNSAAALAAYSAAAGLKCLILLEPGNPPGKLRQAVAVGARVIPVQGVFDHGPEALAELMVEVANRLNYYLAFIHAPVNPYILEGIKTISYEVAARLHGAPDAVVCPVGGGDMLTAQWRGYLELKRAGVIESLPRMIAVQSVSAPPLLDAFRSGADRGIMLLALHSELDAFRSGADHVSPLPSAASQLSGINVRFTGDHALAAGRDSEGVVAGIRDEEALAMQARLAREEGLWVEPASAAPLAALPSLLARGEIRPDERVVCLLSGAGFKDARLGESEAAEIGQREPAAFDVEAITKHI